METVESFIVDYKNGSSFRLKDLHSWANLEEHLGKANK